MRVKKDIEMELLVYYKMMTSLTEKREELDPTIYNGLMTKYQSKADTLKWVLEESEQCLL